MKLTAKHEKIARLMSPAQRKLLLAALADAGEIPQKVTSTTLSVLKGHNLITFQGTKWCRLTKDGMAVAGLVQEREKLANLKI